MENNKCTLRVTMDTKTGEYISTISSDEEQTQIYFQDKEGHEAWKLVSYFPAAGGGPYRSLFKGIILEETDSSFIMQGKGMNGSTATLKIKKNKVVEVKFTWVE